MKIRLKHWRLARELANSRLSQNAWAQRLGLSSSHLSMLVKGRRPYPDARTRRKLLTGLGLSFHDLFEADRRRFRRRFSRQGQASSGRRYSSGRVEGGWIVQDALQDLRFGWRMLAKRPAFSALAILTLALGIGINTAIYSVVDAVLLRPFPYRDPGRLVVVWETNPVLGVRRAGPSGPTFIDWKEQSRSFEGMALIQPGTGTFWGLKEPEQVPGMRVTVNLFDFLGVQAALGRTFLPEEGGGGRKNSVIFSHDFWQTRFAGDPDILGRQVMGDGLPYTVVGILPADFRFPLPTECFVPWDYDELRNMDRQDRQFGVLARLKPQVGIEEAQAELDAVSRRAAQDFPQAMRDWGTTVVPLKQALFEHIQPALWVLLGAVGFVLLIACANVANLLLARASARSREISIRATLGAGRARLVRQLLTEGLLLGALGGLGGLMAGIWGHDLLRNLLPDRVPVPDGSAEVLLPSSGLDYRVLLFTLAASLLTSLLFALVPALQASRTSLVESQGQGGRLITAGGQIRLRGLLIGAEVALSLVLLVGAGLMIQSFTGLQAVDPGLRPDNILTMQSELPTDSRYQSGPEQSAFFEQVLKRIRAVPGVVSAGASESVPLDQTIVERIFTIEGRNGEDEYLANYRRVSSGYFETMGIPLLEGRTFDQRDRQDSEAVAVIDASLAPRYWPDENPVGRRLSIRDGLGTRRIVGVVGAVRQAGLNREAYPTLYVPHLQRPAYLMTLVVRTRQDPSSMVQAVKQAVWSVDARQPVYQVRTMEQILESSLDTQRITFWLLAAFALAAVALAAVGIYGVMSFTVAQRTQEIGIRMALGASPREVLRMVSRQGLVPVLAGVALGWVISFFLTRFLSSLLHQLSPHDPLTFAAVSLLLVLTALLAGLLPARRASRVDPVVALNEE